MNGEVKDKASMKPLKLSIEGFLGLKNAEIEITKTILYGANGTGKSRAIYALLHMIDPDLLRSRMEKYPSSGKISIETSDNGKIEYKDGFFECGGIKSKHRFEVASCIGDFFSRAGVRSYAWITFERTVYSGMIGGDVEKTRDLLDILKDPERVEELEDTWSLYTTISKLYYDNAKTKDGYWISPSQLSTGEKTAMLITYFAKKSDLLIIEAFEGGLHPDLAIDLITWLNNNAKHVMLETHLGILLPKALELGWNVYLFNYRKPPVRIKSKEELLSQEQFKEELNLFF